MIQFIVSDPACPVTDAADIHKYKVLTFARCQPKMVDKVREGLQGLTGNVVPVFQHTDWQFQADKLLSGKG